MLTVKHISPSGDEVICLAREVRKSPKVSPTGTGSLGAAGSLWIDEPDGSTRCLGSWGTFYVMNEQGSTVAKYDFGGWAGPSGEDGVIGVKAVPQPPSHECPDIHAVKQRAA